MEIPRGWGVSEAKILKGTYGLYWKFQRGGGLKTENLSWEGYGYFLEQHKRTTYQGFIAQLVEQRTSIAKVMHSNPVVASKFRPKKQLLKLLVNCKDNFTHFIFC